MEQGLSMTQMSHRTSTWFCISFAIVIAVAGCEKAKTAADYLKSAQTDRDAEKIPAAIIELKNALQLEPKNIAARILLGECYLDLGQPTEAEAEFSHAVTDGADPGKVILPLAQAALMEGQPGKALAQPLPADSTGSLKASLLGVRADAEIMLGRLDDARDSLEKGEQADPLSNDLMLSKVRYLVASKDFSAARALAMELAAKAPRDSRVDSLLGIIDLNANDFAAAQKDYQRIATAQPWNLRARLDLARAQIAAGQLSDAIATLQIVLKAAPNEPNALYLRALAAFREKDYPTAQANLQRLMGTVRDFAPGELLAGATSYALKHFEEADSYLTPYVYQHPKDVSARKLLASVQIAMGHPSDAFKTLSPAVDDTTEDTVLLSMIGAAAARSGDLADANRYLSLAVEKQPTNSSIRTQLGVTQLAMGQTDSGIETLETAVQQNADATQAEVALLVTYLQNKQFANALVLAEKLEQERPTDSIGYNFAGLALIGEGKNDQAETALLKAREIHPGDAMALRNLATLALRGAKLDVAIGYYQELIKANPKDASAYISLAELLDKAGKRDEVEPTLRKGIDQNPDAAGPRIVIARILLQRQEYTQAIEVIQPAVAANPRDSAVLETLGQIQLASGQPNIAISTFHTLSETAPKASGPHRDLARAYAAAHNLDDALSEIRTANELDPNDLVAKKDLAELLLQKKDYGGARAIIAELLNKNPGDIQAVELSGLTALAQNRGQDAIGAFKQAIEIKDNYADEAHLALAQQMAGDPDAAQKTLQAEIGMHPDDLVSRMTLGNFYIGTKRIADAEAQYAEVFRQAPDNVVAENDLAWTLSRLNRPSEALEHAQHASKIAPNSPEIMDTLGVTLQQNRDVNAAVIALRKASGLAPDNLQIKFHLAEALAGSGSKDEARGILRNLVNGTPSLPDKSDAAQAQKLLAQLGG